MIVKWMRQGMPYGKPTDPKLEAIEVHPAERVMKPGSQQQLVVLARMTDGSVDDITHSAVYEANDREFAEADNTGLVTAGNHPGEIAVMIRYQDKASVFRASVPLGAPVDSLPSEQNFVDKFIFAKLKKVGMPPSAVADDSIFLRRVTLDIAGRLPTVDEAKAFAADKSPHKRTALVERLLRTEEYAEFFANKWSSLLRNKRANGAQLKTTMAFYDWIKESFYNNKPYDRFVRARFSPRRETSSKARRRPGSSRSTRSRPKWRTRRSCSSAPVCSVPSATIIRSRNGRKTITTASWRFSREWARQTPVAPGRT